MVSDRHERSQLPNHAFQSDKDGNLSHLNAHWEAALKLAADHGYHNIVRTMVPGAVHSALAEQVVDFCSTVLARPPAG